MSKKILVVEDEKNISKLIEYNLIKEGFEVVTAFDGEDGLKKAHDESIDLILLDIMLPIMDGFEVCSNIRRFSQVPIIFVTAREEEKDKIFGLDTGADDYVTKPFSFNELLARIKANIRRSARESIQTSNSNSSVAQTIVVKDLTLDLDHYSVTKSGVELELSKKDYDVLLFLAKNIGKAFSREELLNGVWGYEGYFGDVRTVDVTICRLRNKIESNPSEPEYLLTKRGIGYYLNDK